VAQFLCQQCVTQGNKYLDKRSFILLLTDKAKDVLVKKEMPLSQQLGFAVVFIHFALALC